MPQKITPYEEARQRMRALRTVNPPQPKRTWWDTAKDYGTGLKESGIGVVEGVNDMLHTMSGDLPTAARKAGEWGETFNNFRNNSNPDRAKAMGLGIADSILPVSQVYDDYQHGEYAKAAGHATIPLALLGLGAKSALRGSVVEAPPPRAPLTPPAPRTPLRLPGPGGTGPGATRFISGDAGVADVTTPYRMHMGGASDPFFPEKVGGTQTLTDVGEVIDVGPTVAAQGMGPHPLPPRSVGSQRTALASQTRKQMLGERARVPKTAKKITKAAQQSLVEGGEVEPVQMPGFDNRTLFKGKEDFAPQEISPHYPATDPGVVEPVVDLSEVERLRNATARPSNGAQAPAKHPRPGQTKLRENFPSNKAIPETIAESNKAARETGRPFSQLTDADLKTLAQRGDKAAVSEILYRSKRVGGNGAGRLANERGEVNFGPGIEKAKGQIKKVAKKVPGILGDLQRGALLTGAAIPKSLLGAAGGLVAEVGERAATHVMDGKPSRILGDIKKVGKSVPAGLRRGMRGLKGEDDLAEAQRHLSPPGPFSKPALRAMAAFDGPFREALESLGLSHEEALRRVLNAKPASKTGRDLLTFLRKHPAVKNVIAPVGATTSTNMIEQGLLRTPGINMLSRVKKMDPATMIPGRTAVRAVGGAAAAGAGVLASEELGDKNYLLKGLLTALAGPYGLPMGLGMAFASEKDLASAIDNIGNSVGREAPVRIPTQKLSKEVEKRFTPAIIRQLTDEDAGPATSKKSPRRKRSRAGRRPQRN